MLAKCSWHMCIFYFKTWSITAISAVCWNTFGLCMCVKYYRFVLHTYVYVCLALARCICTLFRIRTYAYWCMRLHTSAPTVYTHSTDHTYMRSTWRESYRIPPKSVNPYIHKATKSASQHITVKMATYKQQLWAISSTTYKFESINNGV